MKKREVKFKLDENGDKLIKYLGSDLYDADTDKMFAGTGIKAEVPSGVKTIGTAAFMMSDVSEIVLPEGVEEIESDAFALAMALKKIRLPSTLKSIGSGAFGACVELKEIYIPESVENIGEDAFKGCLKLKIFLAGEVKKGFVQYTEEQVEYVDESYAFDFHRGGVSPPSYVEHRTVKHVSWNPDNRPVETNVNRPDA